MPAILRRRKLISIKPERKNAVTYRKEEVQAEVMTPPPAADQQKIPGSTVVCPACKREVNKAEVEKISMSAMSVEAISACGLKTGSAWWQMQEPLNHGLNIWNQKIHWIFRNIPRRWRQPGKDRTA